MQKIIRHIQFLFDYYVGYFLTNAKKADEWSERIANEYPEKFKNNK